VDSVLVISKIGTKIYSATNIKCSNTAQWRQLE